MEHTDHSSESEVARLADPDPFELTRLIRARVQACSEKAKECEKDVYYLWIHVSDAGIAQANVSPAPETIPTLDQWLNVVDEAAASGVHWLVITMDTALNSHPDIWKIAGWAQDAYGMVVGFHPKQKSFTEKDLEPLMGLQQDKTQLLVKKAALPSLEFLADTPILVMAADPQEYDGRPNCEGPAHMVFINPKGQLYTCGLVEDSQEYKLGTIFQESFEQILHDPKRPHKLSEDVHWVAEGCDACPALLANFMHQYQQQQ